MKITQYLTIYLKGLAMGSADVVPGVSGGTVAFITGIYERLLQCISHVDRHLLHLVYKGQWKAAWKYMDGGFLLSLLLGIASAFLLLSRVILYLMEHQRPYKFVEDAFKSGSVRSTGTAMDSILPNMSMFTATNERGRKRETVLDKLTAFFNKFFDISGGKL